MREFFKHRTMIFLFIVFFLCTYFLPLSLSKTINHNYEQTIGMISGQILFAPMDSSTTYLIDNNGTIIHTWSSKYFPGEAVYWGNDGTILRTIKIALSGNGAGGGIQKIAWDGTILWEYTYYTSEVLSHHDIEPLPNGNVLMIAWETKTRAEAIAAGRNPNYVSYNGLMPDHVIEVQPTGPTSGDIVWEWHVWDHLIQDYDASKENYGVVGDHPELVDINYVSQLQYSDWLHTNSIDYNKEFEQILISVHNFNEIWVIDHSTTTEEAASHIGGNSGKGGDLLYRWGNPQAYDAGTSSDQKLINQHDATWIKSGCPGEGNILVFNNGGSRYYSTVDEIIPPVNDNGEYYLAPGSAYGPEAQTWIYTADPPTSFYATYLSGCERLPNGNTLICDGPAGRFFEVTPDMVTVWEYINSYPNPLLNNVFKIEYIPPPEPPEPGVPDLDCEGSFSWTDIKPGSTLTGSFEVRNIGDIDSFLNWTIDSFPSWGNWSFTPNSGVNLTPDEAVGVQTTVIAPDTKNEEFEGYIRVVNQNNPYDFHVIPVYLKTAKSQVLTYFLNEFLSNHPYLFPILRHLMGY